MANLQQLLQDTAAYVNQDPTLVTGTDLTAWANLVNQAQNEWGDTYQWRQLRYTTVPTTVYSQASIGLASTFKKLMSPVYDFSTGISSPTKYEQIRPEDRFNKDSTDKYVYLMGNDSQGKYLVINPPLASGVSLSFDWQSTPSSMATLQDVAVCPSREYLVKRTIQYILSARSDSRFPQIKSEADELLSNMIEEEAAISGGQQNTTPDYYKSRNFRLGE